MSHGKSGLSLHDRRRFLEYTWGTVGAGLALALVPRSAAFASGRLGRNPFTLGVASGDPTPDGTCCGRGSRPSPPIPTSLGRRVFPVGWRVARDSRMHHVVERGVAFASPELAHSVHVEVSRLRPGRDYFYQFDAARRGEPDRPLPHRARRARAGSAGPLRLRHLPGLAERLLHRVSGHAGRTTSTSSCTSATTRTNTPSGPASRRGIPTPAGFGEETVDLRTYRLRHTLYKLDPDLQAAHARFPFAVIWDDHEVQNDYSGLAPEWGVAVARVHRPAGRRLPGLLRAHAHPRLGGEASPGGLRIYRRLDYGRLAEFTLLDDRQYRTDNPCGDGESLRCDGGAERRLHHARPPAGALGCARDSRSRRRAGTSSDSSCCWPSWSTCPISDERYWNDAWDGYPRARRRLLNEVVRTDLRNPVFLTGDWHSTFVNDLKLDFKDAAGGHGRHRVRHPGHHHRRRRHALRAVLRAR